MVTKKITYAEEAKDRLLEQFHDLPNFAALLDVYSKQVQDIENALFQLIDERFIDDAIGLQLDGLGQIIDEPRGGKDDDDYRAAIKRKIGINKSSGLIEDILVVVTSLTGSSQVELTRPGDPAHFNVTQQDILDPAIIDGATVSNVIHDIKGGGIRAIFLWHEVEPVFGFLGTAGALGFGAGAFVSALDR